MGYRMTMVLSRMPMPMPNGSHIPTFLLHKPQGIFLKPLFVHSAPAAPAFVWGIALKTSTFMSMFAGRARNANVKSNSNSNSNSNSSSNLNHNVVSEMDDLSVFRFTLGIVGFDESYLPRIIGILFGFLLVLNHVFTQTSVTAAQLRSELAGALLAAIAITLPYVGKRLQTGMSVARQQNLSADCREVFLISEYLSDVDKEDLAWGSYAVLRNTVSSSLLIYHSELLCARGCWDIPVKVSKDDIFTLLECEIDQMGLSYVTTTLYFPDNVGKK